MKNYPWIPPHWKAEVHRKPRTGVAKVLLLRDDGRRGFVDIEIANYDPYGVDDDAVLLQTCQEGAHQTTLLIDQNFPVKPPQLEVDDVDDEGWEAEGEEWKK